MKIMNKDLTNDTITLSLTAEEFEEHFAVCHDCGELILSVDAVHIHGETYCQDCQTTCCECGRHILLRDAFHTQDSDYDYCESCFAEVYVCATCGDHYRYEEEGHYHNGEWYCDSCHEELDLVIRDYHTQKDYGDIVFYGDEERQEAIFIGYELEIDADHRVDREEIARELKDRFDSFFAYEYDGSLRNGFEIISQPASLSYHLGMMPKYRDAFRYLLGCGMKSHDIGTCGLHCHLDRRYFGKREDSSISKMLYLFEKFRPELMQFSRRTEEQASSWCRSRKQNYGGAAGWIKDAVTGSKYRYNYQDRYYALNLTNAETLEVRLWRGSLNGNTFEATLRFTARLCDLCKHTPAVKLAKFNFDDLLGDDPVILAYWDRVCR